jgi:hypothetical protein
MSYAYALNRPLTDADAAMILGAVYFYLNEKHVCNSLADMHAHHAAQADVLRLRASAFKSAYGRVQS